MFASHVKYDLAEYLSIICRWQPGKQNNPLRALVGRQPVAGKRLQIFHAQGPAVLGLYECDDLFVAIFGHAHHA
ncbi:hypothetical protein D3C72_2448710 [compost metagenome]